MEALYRQYFEAMPCYLTIQDREFKIIDANRRFKRDFGDFAGRYCYQVYKHRSERCEVCPVDRTFRDGLSHGSEEQVKCLDGRDVSVIVYTTPIRDEAGQITSVLEMSTDITEIKILQNLLRESQTRYRLIFEEVPCYISIQDRDLNIVEANRQFKEDFGNRLGCKCYEIYKHRTEECFPCPVQATFQDAQVHESEEVVTSKNGDRVNVLVYTTPIRDGNGEIKSVMEMSTNITQIRQLQSQLTSLGLLIGSISHGVKGLLNGLDGGIYMVNSGMDRDKPERVKQGWEIVQRNICRIRSMVLDILYYAKDREPDWEPISTITAIEEVSGIMELKAKEQGIEFRRAFDRNAGSFEGDAKAIRSLLVNLLENSLDACRIDKKKDAHYISVGVTGHPEHVVFDIQDNGIGMDQETREKAFSLFFSSKGVAGTGLGLFISNKIALAHGGTIELESGVGRGTRFLVKIPRKRLQEQPEESYAL
ncbi:MAG: PAS domain-containing sensor histidine kinase [Candidatus Abyssobacteria bacterium SURF_17]|jgi:PAS domain S-box-containing protein|uniref:histidine kinase n=1 Tax=Candidatus Abyssobacteria bacterium SURF_17 TaxID=2093361 RepID=A0A419F353_9BACT|nr:MAG: PAS domain-containing sensor histidine kinase [Candidatus Abyssubacteria bacterium SURF_17]